MSKLGKILIAIAVFFVFIIMAAMVIPLVIGL